MSDLIQSFFGLKRHPFGKEVPPELLWMDTGRTQAVDRLVDTVVHRQHALVTGEPGVGKTCVLRALRHRLSEVHYRVHYIAHVTLGRRDFYRQICYALGVGGKGSAAGMFEAIQRSFQQESTEHRAHSVLVLDEAQLMPDTTLSHLHVLANFDWDSAPMLSLVFVGLPELHRRLSLSIHRTLLSRIHTKVELAPGTPDLTATYVRQRLSSAGARGDIFNAEGLALLHEETGGILRSVDVLAVAAMRLAAAEERPHIGRKQVRAALHHTPLI